MPWIAHAYSDVGDREDQQDRYLIVRSDSSHDHLLVVADGAGGHKQGALAAQTAINCISENAQNLWTSEDPSELLERLIKECNEQVLRVGQQELACTTLVIAFLKGEELYWGHVGDSRLYLIRDGQVVFQTADHSIDQLKRDQQLQNFGKDRSSTANGLYMCLGALKDIAPDVTSGVARSGDSLLLCSDGFWGQLEMDSVVKEISQKSVSQQELRTWTTRAKDNKLNQSDNITVVTAQYAQSTTLLQRLLNSLSVFIKK